MKPTTDLVNLRNLGDSLYSGIRFFQRTYSCIINYTSALNQLLTFKVFIKKFKPVSLGVGVGVGVGVGLGVLRVLALEVLRGRDVGVGVGVGIGVGVGVGGGGGVLGVLALEVLRGRDLGGGYFGDFDVWADVFRDFLDILDAACRTAVNRSDSSFFFQTLTPSLAIPRI